MGCRSNRFLRSRARARNHAESNIAHGERSMFRILLEDLIQVNYIWMRRQTAKRLDLPQAVNLLDGWEPILHALDCCIFASLDRLSLNHFRKSAFALFINETILCGGSRRGRKVRMGWSSQTKVQRESVATNQRWKQSQGIFQSIHSKHLLCISDN